MYVLKGRWCEIINNILEYKTVLMSILRRFYPDFYLDLNKANIFLSKYKKRARTACPRLPGLLITFQINPKPKSLKFNYVSY